MLLNSRISFDAAFFCLYVYILLALVLKVDSRAGISALWWGLKLCMRSMIIGWTAIGTGVGFNVQTLKKLQQV